MNHFKLTNETKVFYNTTLYRIEATVDIVSIGVKKGDKGGFIEKESNLHDQAWVFGDARVFGDACVSDNARVFGNAQVYGDARVFGDACVSDNAQVFGNACVSDNAWVFGNACVSDNAWVFGNARVSDNAQVYGDARVFGDARVYGDAHIDCASAILWITLGGFYTATITKKLIFIGCQKFTKKQILKISKKDAINKGLPKEFADRYRAMIIAAMKLVK